MKLKTSILVCIGICFSNLVFSQDIHFSQMEFTPLAINPALAGANHSVQGIVNYRSQWRSFVQPFQTSSASFDARLNKPAKSRNGYLAAGVFFFSDNAGEPRISTTNINLNLAYHLVLGKKSTIGLGLYGGYGQRAMVPPTGKWATQYDGFSYDGAAASGETFANLSFSYLDAGAGLVYTYGSNTGYITQNKTRKFNVGLAAYHVNRPNHSFVGDGNEVLPIRFSGFVNAEIGIQNTTSAFLPGFYYQNQGSASEIFLGGYYKIIFNSGSKYTANEKPFSLSIGLFGRWQDAFVGKVLLDWDRYSIGMSYDINTSRLSSVSNFRGGFELFLRYSMLRKK
jgi:type IX secretion system PorP/SprF family membrane protein